jgi:hypothetical protein
VRPQEPHAEGIQQERALTREADLASLGIELEKLAAVEIVGAQDPLPIDSMGSTSF